MQIEVSRENARSRVNGVTMIFLRRQNLREETARRRSHFAQSYNNDIRLCLPSGSTTRLSVGSIWRFDPSEWDCSSLDKCARSLFCRNSCGKGHRVLQLVFHELMHEEDDASRHLLRRRWGVWGGGGKVLLYFTCHTCANESFPTSCGRCNFCHYDTSYDARSRNRASKCCAKY